MGFYTHAVKSYHLLSQKYTDENTKNKPSILTPNKIKAHKLEKKKFHTGYVNKSEF